MKKFTAFCGLVMAFCCFLFAGCSNLSMPSNNIVTSNEGIATQVGEYLYFANAYSDKTLVRGDNETNSVKEHSLYRTKLVDGNIELDEDGKDKNLEKVLSKIVAFDKSKTFVSGDYLYFTSPNTLLTKENETRFDLTALFSVKLDGSGLNDIYTTDNATSSFEYRTIAGKDYCFIRDGKKLIRIELGTNEKKELVDDLTGVAIDYNGDKIVAYYTSAREDSQAGNILNKVDVMSGTKTVVDDVIGNTYTLNMLADGVLYYTKSTTSLKAYYYYNDFSQGLNSEKSLIYATKINDFKYVGETALGGQVVSYIFENQLNIVVINDSYYTSTQLKESTDTYGTIKNVMFTDEEYTYFLASNGIYRVDYKTKLAEKVSGSTDVKADLCDVVGNYFYYYTKAQNNTTGTYYLHRVSLANAGEKEIEVKCIAQLLEADMEKTEE